MDPAAPALPPKPPNPTLIKRFLPTSPYLTLYNLMPLNTRKKFPTQTKGLLCLGNSNHYQESRYLIAPKPSSLLALMRAMSKAGVSEQRGDRKALPPAGNLTTAVHLTTTVPYSQSQNGNVERNRR
jgi:hypothetical protein